MPVGAEREEPSLENPMKLQRVAIMLCAVNLLLLALLLGRGLRSTPPVGTGMPQAVPPAAQEVLPILRGSALEIVDERGQVRSRLNVEPNGEVVLRLLDRDGTIRVKLGADEGGSGLLLLDEVTEPGVHMIARRSSTSARPTTTSLTLRTGDGRERILTP